MSAIVRPIESSTLTDEVIVGRVVDGDTPLYELLVRRHNQRVYRAVRAILRDDAESEDAMQQAYVSAFRHLSQFRGTAKFSTWLVRIAVHEARGRLRRSGRHLQLVNHESKEVESEPRMQSPQNPERRVGASELGHVLETLIAELSENLRAVFVLREVEGMSTHEVAEVLEISDDNVKTRLSRARSELRDAITEKLGAAALEVWLFENPRCDAVARYVMAEISK